MGILKTFTALMENGTLEELEDARIDPRFDQKKIVDINRRLVKLRHEDERQKENAQRLRERNENARLDRAEKRSVIALWIAGIALVVSVLVPIIKWVFF
jgi:hypothetical protein